MVILFVWDCVEKYDGVGRGGACVPARVALQGRIHRSNPPRTMRIFLIWKRRCVPARVALQGRIHRSIPRAQCVCFGMETPLRGRSGGHTGAAPTVSFGWIACGWLMSFGQVARGMGDFVWVVLFVCWLVKTVHMNQHHRCYTFDSPGLPTIGGYPG